VQLYRSITNQTGERFNSRWQFKAPSLIFILLTLWGSLGFGTTAICEDVLLINKNGFKPMEKYGSPNARTVDTHVRSLGPEYSQKFPNATRLLDSGGGYGVAVLDQIGRNPEASAVVINAQDAWQDVVRDGPTADYLLQGDKILKLAAGVGVERYDVVTYHEESGQVLRSKDWDITLRNRIRDLIQRVGKRFDYRVGFAEVLLRNLQGTFDLISDAFGAYYYSGGRLKLLDQYYDRLAEGGMAAIIFRATDRDGKVSHEHGPKNLINGEIFEEYLARTYPTIFKIITAGNYQSETKVLLMTRDPLIKNLGLDNILEISRTWFEESLHEKAGPWESEIPNIEVRKK
jgi:SAM-dependent methyltransferase